MLFMPLASEPRRKASSNFAASLNAFDLAEDRPHLANLAARCDGCREALEQSSVERPIDAFAPSFASVRLAR
jgi:hypothetical protein